MNGIPSKLLRWLTKWIPICRWYFSIIISFNDFLYSRTFELIRDVTHALLTNSHDRIWIFYLPRSEMNRKHVTHILVIVILFFEVMCFYTCLKRRRCLKLWYKYCQIMIRIVFYNCKGSKSHQARYDGL